MNVCIENYVNWAFFSHRDVDSWLLLSPTVSCCLLAPTSLLPLPLFSSTVITISISALCIYLSTSMGYLPTIYPKNYARNWGFSCWLCPFHMGPTFCFLYFRFWVHWTCSFVCGLHNCRKVANKTKQSSSVTSCSAWESCSRGAFGFGILHQTNDCPLWWWRTDRW